MKHPMKAAALAAGLIIFVAFQGTPAAEVARPDDAARYLAGIQPSADSPLVRFTRDAGWKQHAQSFDTAWKQLDRVQLSKIRPWSAEQLKARGGTLFYMFSGPDFLYADAFFPHVSTYVLSGLEPVGQIPEIGGYTVRSLPTIRGSLNAVLNLSFFITKQMREQLQRGELAGTLPILYVFIARSGKTIREVKLVSLERDGTVGPAGGRRQAGAAPGVKIVFGATNRPPQTLYYFQTDLSDGGVNNSGFLKFCAQLGRGNSLLKSASYLLHRSGFARIRQFILDQSDLIVQDDSGVPIAAFKPQEWRFALFGKYASPIEIFHDRYQPALRQMYQTGSPRPLEFGVGYRWRPNDSNLLVAINKRAPASGRQVPMTDVPRPSAAERAAPKRHPDRNPKIESEIAGENDYFENSLE